MKVSEQKEHLDVHRQELVKKIVENQYIAQSIRGKMINNVLQIKPLCTSEVVM